MFSYHRRGNHLNIWGLIAAWQRLLSPQETQSWCCHWIPRVTSRNRTSSLLHLVTASMWKLCKLHQCWAPCRWTSLRGQAHPWPDPGPHTTESVFVYPLQTHQPHLALTLVTCKAHTFNRETQDIKGKTRRPETISPKSVNSSVSVE